MTTSLIEVPFPPRLRWCGFRWICHLSYCKGALLRQITYITVIGGNAEIRKYIGCFGCWLKTQDVCVIKDEYQNILTIIISSHREIICSECIYGGLSPFIKNVLDRSISYLLPYMEVRGGEMHHKSRYNHHGLQKATTVNM